MYVALLADYLETYNGRDKVLRTLSYATKLATIGAKSKEAEKKLKIFSSQMSSCRIILRLLDDIPALHNAISYKTTEETDWLIRWVDLFQVVVDVIYCPVEHIAWAGEQKLISINTNAWDSATTWFWILSLHLSLIKSLRNLKHIEEYKKHLKGTHSDTGTALTNIYSQRRNEILTCIRMLLDISYAVSYLPIGTFWGGKLKTWQVGALGTMSSFIGLYQSLSKLQRKKYS